MGRAPCCDKANVKKGPWSPEEDAKLKSYIHQNGTGGNWIALPQKIGLKRCGKSCRLRWLNYLRPNIKHGAFSQEEDNIICGLYLTIGSRWSIIAAQLPGRTDNDIKNYWNTRLKKKLLGKHRKEKRGAGKSAVKPSLLQVAQPPVPVPVQEQPPPPAGCCCFNDYASIKNLLIRLGGRFDHQNEHINLQYPPALLQVQPLYNPMDHLPLLNTPSLPPFDDMQLDDDGIMHDTTWHKYLQRSCFYDETTTSAMEMEEIMNSSVFAASNNQAFLQGPINFAVDKTMSYPVPGIQFNDLL